MENISLILHFDGFYVNRRFMIRECSYITINDTAKSLSLNLTEYVSTLSLKERKTVHYVYRNISGLPFKPRKNEMTTDFKSFKKTILEVYNVSKTNTRNVIAYKGGAEISKFLDDLNLPKLNLDEFDCPSFESLNQNSCEISCSNHEYKFRCGLSKVTVFRDWVLRNLLENSNV